MAALGATRKVPLKFDLMPPRVAVQGLLSDGRLMGQMTGSW